MLGCLVACRGPVRPAGLIAGWLPGAWWDGGFPGCGPGCRGGPGPRLGWPRRVLRGGAVPVRAAPGPVPEPAPADHGGCRVMAGRFGVVLPQRGEPVLGSPPGGVGRINDDDVQARVGGHLHEAVTEFPGGDAGHSAPEGPAAPTAGRPVPGPFASFGAGLGKVEILDDDRVGAVFFGGGNESGDGGSQPPVPGRCRLPGQVQANDRRGAEDVAVRRDDGGGEVADVDVDGHHGMPAELVQGRDVRRGHPPRGRDIPAAAGRIAGDVIADRAAGRLRGDLIAPVGELDRA